MTKRGGAWHSRGKATGPEPRSFPRPWDFSVARLRRYSPSRGTAHGADGTHTPRDARETARLLEPDAIDTVTEDDVPTVVNLAVAGDGAPVDYRALCAFNRDPAGRTLAGIRVHDPLPAATVERFRDHARACRTALELSEDLHAATGLALAQGLLSGAAGLVTGLERLDRMLDARWDALAPPLKASRPAKAWNARKDAIEVLHDRAMDVAYLHRLPLFGLDGDTRLCRRAFLIAAGEHGAAGLSVDAPTRDRDGAETPPDPADLEASGCTETVLHSLLQGAGPEALADLRRALARGAALAGRDGIGARFAARARETSAALGAEARGEGLSLDPVARWCEEMAARIDRLLPDAASSAAAPAGAPVIDGTASGTGAGSPSGTGPAAMPAPASGPAAGTTIDDADEARTLMVAAIDRICADEPGSPALPFLTLAEALHGRSLATVVAALDPGGGGTLLDALARIEGPLDALVLGRDPDEIERRLSERAESVAPDGRDATVDGEDDESGDGPNGASPPARFARRAEAWDALRAVAAFLRADTPSSVVPALLERGAALAGSRFEDVVGELARAARAADGAADG